MDSMKKPKIEISPPGDKPSIKLPPDPNEWLKDRYDFQTKIIIGIFAVALLTMIFMAATMLLDAWHFNSVIYREYSEKVNTLESLQENNKLLLEQNKQNQQLIIEELKQIKELLKKK